MKITFKGEAKTLTNQELKSALLFFHSNLPKRNFQVCVRFDTIFKNDGVDGMCQIAAFGKNKLPNKFILHLKKDLDKFLVLGVAAHELMHIHQFASGDLEPVSEISGDYVYVTYKKKRYKTLLEGHNPVVKLPPKKKKAYKSTPWEVEAYEFQWLMVDAYIDKHCRELKKLIRDIYNKTD